MIRRFVFALSLSTALCAPLCANAETLAETVSQALQTHPQIKEGAAAMRAADKNIHEQKAGFFPVLGLESEDGRIHNNDFTTRADTPSQGASSSWKDGGTVTITQPLFTGFSVENHVDGAQARYTAATYNLSGTEEDVALRAARAHLNLMRTRELLDLASAYLSNIDKRRNNIKLMVKEGAADAAELLQADEVIAAAKNTRLGYEEAYRQAEADYIEVTGTAPVKQLEFGERRWNHILPKTLDDAIAYATTRNAHILAASSLVTAATKDKDAEESSLMPHVDAEMSYTKDNERYDVGDYTSDAQAIIKLAWNFNMGGGQRARIDRFGEERNQAFAKQQEAVRTVEHDTRQKYTSMEIVDQQFSLLNEREQASEKILDNFEKQFEGGKQTNLQLINAHSKLFEAKAARVDAFYRQLLSRFELLNAMGRLREAFADIKSPVEPGIAPADVRKADATATKPAVPAVAVTASAAPKSAISAAAKKEAIAVKTLPAVIPAAVKTAAAPAPKPVMGPPAVKTAAAVPVRAAVAPAAPKVAVAAVAPPAPKPVASPAAAKTTAVADATPVIIWETPKETAPKQVATATAKPVVKPAAVKATDAVAAISADILTNVEPAAGPTAAAEAATVTQPVVIPAALLVAIKD